MMFKTRKNNQHLPASEGPKKNKGFKIWRKTIK